MYSVQEIKSAIEQHGTRYFDADLQPVEPQDGDQFCELEFFYRYLGNGKMVEDAVIEGATVECFKQEGADLQFRTIDDAVAGVSNFRAADGVVSIYL